MPPTKTVKASPLDIWDSNLYFAQATPPFIPASAISRSPSLVVKTPLTGEKSGPPHCVLQVAVASVHCREKWTQSQGVATLAQAPFLSLPSPHSL